MRDHTYAERLLAVQSQRIVPDHSESCSSQKPSLRDTYRLGYICPPQWRVLRQMNRGWRGRGSKPRWLVGGMMTGGKTVPLCRWHHPYGTKWRATKEMKVKDESEKVGLKHDIHKKKIMASGPITSWETDGETVTDFIFFGLQNHCGCWLQPWNLKTLSPWE